MKQLIIGSTAAKHWFPNFREPKDLDIMTEEPLMTREVQHYWIPEFQELLDKNVDDTYLDPNFLLTLKMSHGGYDIKWDKTIYDILFLKTMGCKADRGIYERLVKGWIKQPATHGKKWASLKGKDSTTFFEDAVTRKYVHDSIHEAIAYYERPLFEQLVVGGVSCSEEGFEALSDEDKILLVKEEVWVTALERYLIPSDFRSSVKVAYAKSLKKLATTMSSGWFKFYILDNFEKLYKDDGSIVIEKFRKAEKQNKLQLA